MSDPTRIHQTFLGRNPSEEQQLLYASHPSRGFSTHDYDKLRVEATIVKAMSLAKVSGVPQYNTVYIFTTTILHDLVSEGVREIARTMKSRVSGCRDAEKRRQTLSVAKDWLGALKVGAPSLRDLQVEYDRWVSVGYDREDLVPDWFKASLL